MIDVARLLKQFCKNETANAALEYAILAATVSVVLIAGMDSVGMRLAVTLAKSAAFALGATSAP